MKNQKSVFETLSAINVNEKVEKKNGLTYLSWAWAWGEVKKHYPSATYNVINDPMTQSPYFYDENLGYLVMTAVTIEDQTLEMWLPVMDGANKAMKAQAYEFSTKYGKKTVEGATMFDINKTLMRCLTKNLAMFGLGHYIYAGEDLPETEEVAKPVAKKPVAKKKIVLEVNDDNWDGVLNHIVKNKDKGIDALVKQISVKYNVSPTVKKELAKAIA